MRVLVFEFLTGGGIEAGRVPATLLHEGDEMVRALCADLLAAGDCDVLAVRSANLAPLDRRIGTLRASGHWRDCLASAMNEADVVWPIAPETGGVLAEVSELIEQAGKQLAGSSAEAVRVAGSKWQTGEVLAQRGLPVARAWRAGDDWPDIPGRWVVKPDDGAGSEQTFVVADRAAARAFLGNFPAHVAQPWIDGDARSLSLLALNGSVVLLSVNHQQVVVRDGVVNLDHVIAAIPAPAFGSYARLATEAVRAMRGLYGYLGIDFIETPSGPIIIEINPRLTSSYCGLSERIGINPAARVIADLSPSAVPAG